MSNAAGSRADLSYGRQERCGEMYRNGGCLLWAGQKGGGFSELTRGKLSFASQSVLLGFQQAAEIVALKRMLASSGRRTCMSEKRVRGCLSPKSGWSMNLKQLAMAMAVEV
jgi:hypothetical protein